MEIIRKTPVWMRYSALGLSTAGVLLLLGVSVVKSTIYLGIVSLIFTLIPIHFKRLARYRRDLGITAGILILTHGISASVTYTSLDPGRWLDKSIIGGFVGLTIIIVMLITSNYMIQRSLSGKWRTIHSLIWFALPMTQGHAYLAAESYLGELPTMGIMVITGLGLFGIVKIFLPVNNRREYLRDAILVVLGTIVSFAILSLYPQRLIG